MSAPINAVAFQQMHRDDAFEFAGIELPSQRGAQFFLAAGRRSQAHDAEHGAAALSAAHGDMRHHADHVAEVRHDLAGSIGRVAEPRAIGRAVEHVDRRRGIEEEIFRAAAMGDVAPRLEEASIATRSSRCSRSYHWLNSGSSAGSTSIDVSSMPFPAIGILRYPFADISEARSAIAFITASLTPRSYSEWPAPSTKRISAFGHSGGQRMRGRRRTQRS